MIEFFLTEHTGVQTSGIQCEWRKKIDGGIEFTTFLVNGKPLDENKTYIGAASDYMMGESEKYFGFKLSKLTVLNQTVFSAIEMKVRAAKEISSEIEHRIKLVK
jgi:2',3'-cyclic-nucleotide 2'-phosphodiesterase (5'-nucleotidase family)